ncbi:hypothetical protein ABIE27_006045 [Paenibacillus sp. 4624]|uniref:hypothetical protein n=1 Tax=Paenibacillus sp. 4624 TaxID=3156453 RepID=UPI003D240E30
MKSTEGIKVLAGEVIVPIKIEFVEGSELPFTDLIRKVVREELAAHEERLKGKPELISPIGSLQSLGLVTDQLLSVTHVGETHFPIQVDKKQLAATLDPHFRGCSATDDKTQEDQK